jgi:hypothetical protein
MDLGTDLAPNVSGVTDKLQQVSDTMFRTVAGWPLHVQIVAGLILCGIVIHIVRGIRRKPGY